MLGASQPLLLVNWCCSSRWPRARHKKHTIHKSENLSDCIPYAAMGSCVRPAYADHRNEVSSLTIHLAGAAIDNKEAVLTDGTSLLGEGRGCTCKTGRKDGC